MSLIHAAAAFVVGISSVSVATQNPAATFAGVWVLNKQASQGLSPMVAGADTVTWTIVQDQKTIAITEETVGGQRPSSGTLGSYRLDGTETVSELGGGPASVALKASWAGPRLELVRKQTVSGPTPIETTAVRTLALSDGGKTLTVSMKYQSTRGSTDSTMVFVKK